MTPVFQSGKGRNLTTYIAGNPGKGKTSLIQRMALYDICKGRGVCVIDPTADLVNRLVHWIPKRRVKDTIYFDTDHPIPIDFFGYDPSHPGERRVLVDELVAVFDLVAAPVSKPRLYSMIGTLLDANQNGAAYTLLDIPQFIRDKKFRDRVTDFCPARKPEWEDMPKPSDFAPILDRMRSFTEPGPLRTIFESSSEKLNIAQVIRENKVLLINLNDTETDLFIGSLIAAKFQQAIFARRYIKKSERIPYHLYIDECQTILGYAAKHFEKILTRARKFELCLIMANQIPSDLPEAIQRKFGTIGTLILFKLHYEDALKFKNRVLPYELNCITDLQPFHAIWCTDAGVFALPTPRFLGPSPASYAEYIRKRTIDIYACDTPRECSTKEDGNRAPTTSPKPIPDEPQPEGNARVPSHGGKKKKP